MCNFMDEIDKDYKCKFSLNLGSKQEPKLTCAISNYQHVKCEGKAVDRFCCPHWCQVYHANKVIQ